MEENLYGKHRLHDLFEVLSDRIGKSFSQKSWGDCNEINSTIGKYLSMQGSDLDISAHEIQCVAGYVGTDDCEFPILGDGAGSGQDDWNEDRPLHFWLKYGGKILLTVLW